MNNSKHSNWTKDFGIGIACLMAGSVFILGLGTKIAMLASGAAITASSWAGQMMVDIISSTQGTIGDFFMIVALFAGSYVATSTGIFKFIQAGSRRASHSLRQIEEAGMEELNKVLTPLQEVGVES